MGNLSKHFNREEFACSCGCGKDTVDFELIVALEDVRGYFDAPIEITGGNRCKTRNTEIGGSERSQHIHCKASDFKVKGIHENRVADYLESKYPDKYGIGRYNGRTHLDIRKSKARWDNR